jgi:hypothetical protein
MQKNIELILSLFRNLLNKPVRNAKQGYGSFLTMGFGNDIQYELARRKEKKIKVRPEWYLWICMCSWTLETADELLATSDDDSAIIEAALKLLENKKLLKVEVLNDTYNMKFEFEEGIILSLFSDNTEDDNVQWRLFTPDRKVLVAGPNQKISYHDSSSAS